MVNYDEMILTVKCREALLKAIRHEYGTIKDACDNWAAKGIKLSHGTVNKLRQGIDVSNKEGKQAHVYKAFSDLGVKLERLEPATNLAQQSRQLLGTGDLWAIPYNEWIAIIREARRFYDMIVDARKSFGNLLLQTNAWAIEERLAVASLCDTVLAATYRYRGDFTKSELENVQLIGVDAVASLAHAGNPMAACWYARLIHNFRNFDHDIRSNSVLDRPVLDAFTGESTVLKMIESEVTARNPLRFGVELPEENLQLAAHQAGSVIGTLGHMGEIERMRFEYKKAIEKYPHDVRLPYLMGVWEHLRGQKSDARKYLQTALELCPFDGSVQNGELHRLVRCMTALILDPFSNKKEVEALIGEDAFWIKMRCSVPKSLAPRINNRRKERKLDMPIESLRDVI